MIDPQSEKTAGYHLFLMQSGETPEKGMQEISEVMEILANTFQGSTFAPHVTLLARISADSSTVAAEEDNDEDREKDSEEEIRTKCEQLASELAPFSITLAGVGSEKSFFRALYINVANPEVVMAAHEKALKIFSMKDDAPYLPHLSLMYGNFSEKSISEMLESVSIPDTASFTADCLYLFHTDGSVEDWRLIGEFPFTG